MSVDYRKYKMKGYRNRDVRYGITRRPDPRRIDNIAERRAQADEIEDVMARYEKAHTRRHRDDT